jgi:hypothetical protein
MLACDPEQVVNACSSFRAMSGRFFVDDEQWMMDDAGSSAVRLNWSAV